MCRMVIEACKAGNEQVIADVKRLAKYSEGKIPETAEELCNQVFHTVYMVSSCLLSACRETRGFYQSHIYLSLTCACRACRNKAQRRRDSEPEILLRQSVHTIAISTSTKCTKLSGTSSSILSTLSPSSKWRGVRFQRTSPCRTFKRYAKFPCHVFFVYFFPYFQQQHADLSN